MKSFLLGIWEILEVVLISLATVLFIRMFLVQPFLVSGASMEPNFSSGDYLVVDELSYRLQKPRRGDVVVFRYPNDPDTYFIKRVIGLPGERVVSEGGAVRIIPKDDNEGFILNEPYLPPFTKTPGQFDAHLKDDEYFMMGDNRKQSYDSRVWGAVQEDMFVGIARLKIFPLDEIGIPERPIYN